MLGTGKLCPTLKSEIFSSKSKGAAKEKFDCIPKFDDGVLVWDHEAKEEIIFQYFSNVLGTIMERSCTFDWSRLDLPKINDPEMDARFTMAELSYTIKELPPEKAPGPNGLTGSFYKQCWSTIKDDVLAAMDCFYELRAGPLEKMNGANIVLIPKTEVAEQPKGF